MDWQGLSSLAIVALVAGLILRWKYRSLRRDLSTPCGGSCSCTVRRETATAVHSLENGPNE
jgi:hypothetical protein